MGVATLTETVTVRRALALAAALGLLVPTTQAWQSLIASPGVGLLSLVVTVALLVTAGMLICADDEGVRQLEPALLGLAVLALALQTAPRLTGGTSYSTDDAGFLHAAAVALTHGHNPYATNLGWASRHFGFQPTYTTDGGHWAIFSYPAVSLLVTWVVVSLRATVAAATIVEVGALAVGMVVLFRVLPARVRSLAPLVCVVLPSIPTAALNGVSEVMLLPTMVLVAHRWRDVGGDGRLGSGGVLRAVALGVAVSTNQLAWFFAPFLVTGMVRMRLGDGIGLRGAVAVVAHSAGTAPAVAAVLNGWFFLWDPSAWISAIFASFTRAAEPSGQGLPVNLTLFAHLGGGSLTAFTYAYVLLYLALLAAYLLRFRLLHACCFVFPSMALWAGDRALSTYWTIPAVFVLVSVLSGGGAPQRFVCPAARPWPGAGLSGGRRRLVPLGICALFLPAAAALAVALATPAPLTIRVVAAPQRKGATAVRRMTVSVTNRSGHVLRPHFQTSTSGNPGGFWTVSQGPRALAPGATADYVLDALGAAADPPVGSPFSLEIVTSAPNTFSSASITIPPVQ